MKSEFQACIDTCRQLIHEAAPPYAFPHTYMNLDRPLMPLKHNLERNGQVPRIAALRHALYLLELTEQMVRKREECLPRARADVDVTILTSLSVVSGILWAHGIDLPENKMGQLAA